MHEPLELGPFELQRVIGRGAVGVVWAGTHRDGARTPIAVKVIAPDRVPTQELDTEIRAVAGLDHPGVVMLFDHGVVDGPAASRSGGRLAAGSSYLVMELASGGTIKAFRGLLEWPELRTLLLGLLDALAHAHARGVIHRDLKPANVLLATRQDARPGLKLSDFGIAWALDQADNAGLLIGTPRYMAPEQFLGHWRDYGPWTDLYALGCVAWELATGRPPYLARGASALARRHLSGELPPFRPVRPMPPGLEGWLRDLLAKEHRARFQRAADAAWALDQLGEDLTGEVSVERGLQPDWGSAPTLTLDATLLATGSGSSSYSSSYSGASTEMTALPGAPHEPNGPRSAPRAAPVHPLTWRRDQPPIPVQLLGVGLSLYGVRTVPMTGREPERDRIWEALATARRRKQLRAVVLRGAAGTGKSRLASWMAQRAHELGAATHLTAVHSQLGGPGDGLPRMMARHARCQGLSDRSLFIRLAELEEVRDSAHAAALATLVDGVPRVRFSDADERFAAYGQLLERLASERPVMVWLDDVQWGSEALRFADWMLAQDVRAPILLLLTAQEEALVERPVERELLERLEERPAVETLRIAPLGPGAREDLVRAILGLDSALVAQVAERTGGNPLFTVQLLGDWVQRGILVPGPGGFQLQRGSRAVLPDDLHEVWSTRVERLASDLGASVQAPLEIAAALGQDVDRTEWQAACELAGVDIPPELLDALVRRRLAVVGDAGFSFAHGMLRESLARIARAAGRWAGHNAACAAMLEARGGEPERLGRHLLESGDREQAFPALLRGALARVEAGQHREALWLLGLREEALEALGIPRSDAAWGRGWLARVRAHRGLREDDLAQQEGRRVEASARRHGWAELLPVALERLADIAAHRGDLPQAERLLSESQARYEARGAEQAAAMVLRERGRVATLLGDLPLAEAHTEAARVRFEALGFSEGVALCINLLGDIARLRRRWNEAVTWFEQALALHRAEGRRRLEALTLHGLAEVQRLSGALEQAEEGYRTCIALDEALGKDPSITRLNLGLCLIARARWEEALERLDEVRRQWERERRRGFLGCLYVDMLPALAATQDWPRFDALLAEGTGLLEEAGMVDVDIAWPAQLAGDLAVHHPRRARRAYGLALGQWRALGDVDKVAEVEAALARLGA